MSRKKVIPVRLNNGSVVSTPRPEPVGASTVFVTYDSGVMAGTGDWNDIDSFDVTTGVLLETTNHDTTHATTGYATLYSDPNESTMILGGAQIVQGKLVVLFIRYGYNHTTGLNLFPADRQVGFFIYDDPLNMETTTPRVVFLPDRRTDEFSLFGPRTQTGNDGQQIETDGTYLYLVTQTGPSVIYCYSIDGGNAVTTYPFPLLAASSHRGVAWCLDQDNNVLLVGYPSGHPEQLGVYKRALTDTSFGGPLCTFPGYYNYWTNSDLTDARVEMAVEVICCDKTTGDFFVYWDNGDELLSEIVDQFRSDGTFVTGWVPVAGDGPEPFIAENWATDPVFNAHGREWMTQGQSLEGPIFAVDGFLYFNCDLYGPFTNEATGSAESWNGAIYQVPMPTGPPYKVPLTWFQPWIQYPDRMSRSGDTWTINEPGRYRVRFSGAFSYTGPVDPGQVQVRLDYTGASHNTTLNVYNFTSNEYVNNFGINPDVDIIVYGTATVTPSIIWFGTANPNSHNVYFSFNFMIEQLEMPDNYILEDAIWKIDTSTANTTRDGESDYWVRANRPPAERAALYTVTAVNGIVAQGENG